MKLTTLLSLPIPKHPVALVDDLCTHHVSYGTKLEDDHVSSKVVLADGAGDEGRDLKRPPLKR